MPNMQYKHNQEGSLKLYYICLTILIVPGKQELERDWPIRCLLVVAVDLEPVYCHTPPVVVSFLIRKVCKSNMNESCFEV
mmetsp:Transcript_3074/g.5570  ORF Transcript_3074/g.5570 Transcript_3074/m.5570 type:complete len:80 (+) Transcript_3074:156-395(+)